MHLNESSRSTQNRTQNARDQTPRDYSGIQRVLFITFLLHLVAMSAKLSVGFWTGSLSLIADGLDTLFDGISNLVGLLAVRLSSRPPDRDHPYGHRKYETIAALFLAGIFFLTAWELGRDAVNRLLDPPEITVNIWSIAALVIGASIQGFIGVWQMRKARQFDSEFLRADARHSLATIGVSATVLVGLLFVRTGYLWVDPAVALLVAGIIAKIGFDTVRENLPPLLDEAPLAAEKIGAVVESVEGVESYHRIRSRGALDHVAIDLHVRVAPHLSVQDANAIADEVRRRLLALPGVTDVTVHAEAEREMDSATDLYTAAKLAAQELGVVLHESWVQQEGDLISMHLHVGVDPALVLSDAHSLVDKLEQTLLSRQPALDSVHTHIELANHEFLPSARVSKGLQDRIAQHVEAAAADIPTLSHPHNIQTRQVEGRLFIALEAWVDGNLSVSNAHELSTQLQDAIRAAIPNVGEALVHLEPKPTQERPVPGTQATETRAPEAQPPEAQTPKKEAPEKQA
jgi:cation diffusion facilitator family transporter